MGLPWFSRWITSVPIEHRQIGFSVKEVEEILHSYADLVGMILPSGTLKSMLITSAQNGSRSYLMLTFRKVEEKVVHELPLRFASKCLLAYCKDHNIPLPINSSKSLWTNENLLIFRIQMPKNKNEITKQSSRNELGLIALDLVT